MCDGTLFIVMSLVDTLHLKSTNDCWLQSSDVLQVVCVQWAVFYSGCWSLSPFTLSHSCVLLIWSPPRRWFEMHSHTIKNMEHWAAVAVIWSPISSTTEWSVGVREHWSVWVRELRELQPWRHETFLSLSVHKKDSFMCLCYVVMDSCSLTPTTELQKLSFWCFCQLPNSFRCKMDFNQIWLTEMHVWIYVCKWNLICNAFLPTQLNDPPPDQDWTALGCLALVNWCCYLERKCIQWYVII